MSGVRVEIGVRVRVRVGVRARNRNRAHLQRRQVGGRRRLAAAHRSCGAAEAAAQPRGPRLRQPRHVAAQPRGQGRVAGTGAQEARGAAVAVQRAQADAQVCTRC